MSKKSSTVEERAKDAKRKRLSRRLKNSQMSSTEMVSRILNCLINSVPRKAEVLRRRKTFEEESHHSKGLLTVSPNVPKVITNRPTSYKKYVVYTLVL